MPAANEEIIARTRLWLERAVIGLNLCPFAKAVHVKDQIRFFVSAATTAEALLDDLASELVFLRDTDAGQVDTTLLITPLVLRDFAAFTDFLALVEVVLRTHGLDGVLQVASFHPDYVFAGADPDDMANCSNRAPFPILHLLRESSVSRATAALPDAAVIYRRNIDTLRALGRSGWLALALEPPDHKQ